MYINKLDEQTNKFIESIDIFILNTLRNFISEHNIYLEHKPILNHEELTAFKKEFEDLGYYVLLESPDISIGIHEYKIKIFKQISEDSIKINFNIGVE